MNDLLYRLEGKRSALAEIANLSITNKKGELIFIVRVNATDSVSLEVFDFEEYSDYLGYGVKIAKQIRAAKCADFEAVKTLLESLVNLEVQETK
jgi:hypothetical protein